MKTNIKSIHSGIYKFSIESNRYGSRCNGLGSLYFALKNIIPGYFITLSEITKLNIWHYGNIWGCGKKLTDEYGRKL